MRWGMQEELSGPRVFLAKALKWYQLSSYSLSLFHTHINSHVFDARYLRSFPLTLLLFRAKDIKTKFTLKGAALSLSYCRTSAIGLKS